MAMVAIPLGYATGLESFVRFNIVLALIFFVLSFLHDKIAESTAAWYRICISPVIQQVATQNFKPHELPRKSGENCDEKCNCFFGNHSTQ